MFGKATTKIKVMLATAALFAGSVTVVAPAFADYTEILGADAQNTSLRNPLIPGAPFTNPMQAAPIGQPPPVGDGPNPRPEIPGDRGGPMPPPSGMADPTHGNIFPTRTGPGEKGPWEYVPDAGRHQTQNGQQQGVFDFGQEMRGTFSGPGGKNGGTDIENNGGARPDASGFGPGGKNGGTDWGPGGKNGGSTVQNNGGAAMGATDWGGGGKSNGTAWGPGGKNGGSTVQNNGGAAMGATGFGSGGSNGGSFVVNNGGNNGGTGLVNNGGPRSNAQGQGDVLFAHQTQPNRYDFQGPLPTVRTFSRYLVILGVVVATVFVAIASMRMVLGSPYGGSMVIGAAGGLLLLLGGYTIWKIVQMNTFHANSTGWESHYRNGQAQPLNPATPGQARNGNNGGNNPFNGPQNPGNNNGGFTGNNGGFNGGAPNGGFNGGAPNGGFNGGNTGFNGGNTGFNGGNTGFNGGNTGFNGGNTGFNGGNTGFNNTNTGGGGFNQFPPQQTQQQQTGGNANFFNFFNLIPQILQNNANSSGFNQQVPQPPPG